MATLRQSNDEIERAIRTSYRLAIGDPDNHVRRDRLTGKVGYLKARLESCRREAEAIPTVEAELAAALQELEQFTARISA